MNETSQNLKEIYDDIFRGGSCEEQLEECKELIELAILDVEDLEQQLAAEKEKNRWRKWPEEKPELPGEYLVQWESVKSGDIHYAIIFYSTDYGFFDDVDILSCKALCWQPIHGPEADK